MLCLTYTRFTPCPGTYSPQAHLAEGMRAFLAASFLAAYPQPIDVDHSFYVGFFSFHNGKNKKITSFPSLNTHVI